MNVLFVLENYLPHIGGAEIVFMNLSQGLVKLGHRVDIVTHRMKNTKGFERVKGVNIHRVNCFHNRYLFTFFSIPKVIKLAEQSDIIHTTAFNGAPPAWLAGKIKRKKVIITVHELWINRWRELTDFGRFGAFIHDILERMIYRLRFNYYICVSKSTFSQVKQNIGSRWVEVVYNGIDYEQFNPEKYRNKSRDIRKKLGTEKDFVFLFFGRPGASKGVEYAVKAAPLIMKKIPNSKMMLILSKDHAYRSRYSKILKMIEDSSYKERFILLEPQPYEKLPAYVLASDCVIVPSLAEGFGFSCAESCALGLPVVASNTTSLPEVVSGKYNLAEPRNPKSIAQGVINIWEGKYKRTKLKRFLWKDNIEKTLGIYMKFV